METKEHWIRLDKSQFSELHHCIHSWISEVRKIHFDDLNKNEQKKFDAKEFEDQQIGQLFEKFEYIILDESDIFYGVRKDKHIPISKCEGAWKEAVNSKISVG